MERRLLGKSGKKKQVFLINDAYREPKERKEEEVPSYIIRGGSKKGFVRLRGTKGKSVLRMDEIMQV